MTCHYLGLGRIKEVPTRSTRFIGPGYDMYDEQCVSSKMVLCGKFHRDAQDGHAVHAHMGNSSKLLSSMG